MDSDLQVGDKIAIFTCSRDLLPDMSRSDRKRGKLITVEITGVEKIQRTGEGRSWYLRNSESPEIETVITITVKGEPRGNHFKVVPVRLQPNRRIKL